MRRQLSFAVALLVVLLAVALVGAEIVARLLGAEPYRATHSPHQWALQDDVLGWTNRPGSFPSDEGDNAPMTFWEGGRRATRPEIAPAPGQQQVVLVGASITQGYGVRDEQTFAWRIDAALPHASVENYGTGAYSTYQVLLLLDRLFAEGRIEPDLVVYGFPYFTGRRNVATYGWLSVLRMTGGSRFAPPHLAIEDGRVEQRPPSLLASWPLEDRLAVVRAFHDGYTRQKLRDRGALIVPVTRHLLSRMRALVEHHGSRLLVAVLDNSRNARAFETFMRQQRIAYVDCTHPEPVFATPRLMVGGNGHPNEIVHAYYADCIGARIEAELARGERGSSGP